MLTGIVAALAEEAVCNIMSEDEVLERFSIFVTRESGVICAAGRGGMALLLSANAIMVSDKWVVNFVILYRSF